MSDHFEFTAPTRILAGRGVVERRLDAELSRLAAAPVAVVVDRGLQSSGVADAVLGHIRSVPLVVCPATPPDPGLAAVDEAAAQALEAGCVAVLGLGGGSALGVAKAVAIRLRNDGPLLRWVGEAVPATAPSVAVPTTAGSGSEVSRDLVLHEPGRERLVVISGHAVAPGVALLDGELLRTLPRAPMIEAAFDALSHALEALWAHGASAFTDALALAAADAILEALPAALERCDSALQRLIEASAIANLACGNSRLALVHAITSSPQVTLSHGFQNAVLLPHVADFNRAVVPAAAQPLLARLPGLYADVGFEPTFGPHGDALTARRLLDAALRNPLRLNNRRAAEEAHVRSILAAAGAPVPGD